MQLIVHPQTERWRNKRCGGWVGVCMGKVCWGVGGGACVWEYRDWRQSYWGSGSVVRHRGNGIIVWVDSLDRRLLTHSFWSKPAECLSEWNPMVAIRGCPILISMHFKCNSNCFTFILLPSPGPNHNVALSSPSRSPPPTTPATQEMNSPDRCHTAQNDNLPFGNQPLAPLCSLELS